MVVISDSFEKIRARYFIPCKTAEICYIIPYKLEIEAGAAVLNMEEI